ncbi:MAG: cysteine--tRNA ligase, partial [Lachnospiraceae bacterium]|nr:cysteine--tRNA ligase [Lachnospiraceae bacterium]
IHCGGVDNIFPHHTNEIAQSESYLGHKWCNYWFHVHHLNDKTGKMSKSKGDFLTVSLLESKGYNPLVYRMFCLQSHYRKPLEFSYEVLDQVKAAYDKLRKRIAGLNAEKVGDSYKNVDKESFDKFNEDFMNALCSDINTAGALTVVYDVLKADINDDTKKALIDSFDYVLSLGLSEPYEDTQSEVDKELAAYVEEMLAKRKEAKKAKDFATADAIREELSAKGITIKDTREGTVWEINK